METQTQIPVTNQTYKIRIFEDEMSADFNINQEETDFPLHFFMTDGCT